MPEKASKRLRKNEKQWKNEDKNDKLNSKTRKKNKKLTKNQTVPILQRSPHIDGDFFRNQIIPIPPLPEQQAIADYLDKKTSEVDSLISLKQQKITQLKEYKKSLIYEYVTGKRNIH